MTTSLPAQNPPAGCTLLAVDQQRSPLHGVTASQQQAFAFTPYGTKPSPAVPLTVLGFTGERRVASTGHYLLGNGHRALNPVLMRFNRPDALSPFGKGGLNGYAYCAGDPVNRSDPTGTTPMWVKVLLRRVGLIRAAPPVLAPVVHLAPNLRNPAPSGRLPARNPVPDSPTSQVSAASTRRASPHSPTASAYGSIDSGRNWMGSTGTLISSAPSEAINSNVDEHLHAMGLNRPFHGDTPLAAVEPPPRYDPPPPYRSVRPSQPGPPPPYTEVDRIRRP